MERLFRGIFGRRSNADDINASDSKKKKTEQKRPPKQFNSDWNTTVEETEKNLFFRIFDAPSLASQASIHGKENVLTKNKA